MLTRALTHASRGELSNERLEFLGDRVLGLIVAERLYALYPGEPEGALALKLNALVRGEACARAAQTAGLAEHLIPGPAEAGSGGRKKTVILAGAVEAVIAALYLDGGYQVARQFVERAWADEFQGLGRDMRDPKTSLQGMGARSWCAGSQGLPAYKQVGREGSRIMRRVLRWRSAVKGQAPEIGFGGLQACEAEQDAAKRMLIRLGLA